MPHLTTCPLCEALCGLTLELQDDRVTDLRGDALDPLSRGHLCPKAAALPDLHEDPDRLRQPMRRQGDRFVPLSWEEALEALAEGVHRAQARHGRHALGVYVGNPNVHHYDNLLAIQLVGRVLRTRNRYSATSVDQLPHMVVAWAMWGHQLLLPVPDLDRTQHLLILGANPAESNGSLMTAPGVMRRLRAIRERGGRVIVVDPRRTRTAEAADLHVPLRPGTDALLLLAMVAVLFEEGRVAAGPWRTWTEGVETLGQAARPFTPERVTQATGVPADRIRLLARELAQAPCAAVYSRMGASTQRFGGLSTWLAMALNLLTGNLDRPGGMMFPTPAVDLPGLMARAGQTGHMGAWHSRQAHLPEFGGELPVSALSSEIETPGERQVRALITVAGNPVLSTPDGLRLSRALAGLDFMASLDPYINETTRHAHLVLPPPSPLERDHYGLVFHALAVRDTARWSPAPLPPGPGTLREWDVLLELGSRLLRRRGGPRNLGQALGLDALRRLGPARLLDAGLRLGPHRLSLARLRAEPHGVDLGPLRPCLPGRLPTGRVQLAPPVLLADLPRLEEALADGSLAPADQLLLIGRRDQRSNNSWMHNSRRLVKGPERCTLRVHPQDAARHGLTDGGRARVRSAVGQVEVPVTVDEGLLPGVVSLPHGWGHGRQGVQLGVASERPGVSMNDLTDPAVVDGLTGNAVLNGVPVTVEGL